MSTKWQNVSLVFICNLTKPEDYTTC